MDERDQEIRGEEARGILQNDLYKESWVELRETLTRRLESEQLTRKQQLEIVNLLRANRKAQLYLEQVLVTGTFAAQEIERKRTLSERIFRRR